MKKEYIKPEVEYINFYSVEETTITTGDGSGITGEWGETENPWNDEL